MSNSMQPHRQQPTRLCPPWDSPGKNTGVGCHFLLQCMKMKIKVKSLSCVQLFATPWTAAHQAPPSMGFSRQEYRSGFHCLLWKWNRAKAKRVLPREHTHHSKHPLLATQEKTLHKDITRWPIPKTDWLYSLQPKMEKLYTVNKNKTTSWLSLRSYTPYCQIRLKLKEVWKNH